MSDLGIMYRREHAPEHLPAFAARAEKAGFDSLWLVEDCFYGSGIASAACCSCYPEPRPGVHAP